VNDPKPFYKSTGVMGSLAAIVSALVVSLCGGVAGMIGRIKADSPIGKPLACGGVVKGGMYIVGEHGPEVQPDEPWERPATGKVFPLKPWPAPPQDTLGMGVDLEQTLARLVDVLGTLKPIDIASQAGFTPEPPSQPVAEGQPVVAPEAAPQS